LPPANSRDPGITSAADRPRLSRLERHRPRADLCAPVGCCFGGLDAPIIATYTQVFMPALGNYLIKFFPLFLLGRRLRQADGRLRLCADHRSPDRRVDRQGARDHRHHPGLRRPHLRRRVAFVVAFAVFPVAIQMFREGNLPKRLIPASIALGSFTFTMSALPGSPAIQNAIPMPFFHTDAFAAPGLGIIAGL
jgi:hypothetical protein